MSEQQPKIIVQGFSVTYRMKDGKQEPVEWVTYAPDHDPLGTATKVRVKELIPPDFYPRDEEGTKAGLMHLKWNQIKPAYEAWKQGVEIPVDGTPLAVWAGITPEQADVLRSRGLKTVEAVRDATDAQISKVPLPNIRGLRDLAGQYLDGKDKAVAAALVAERDEKIKGMEAMLEEMAARLAAVDGAGSAKRSPGRPRKDEAEAA